MYEETTDTVRKMEIWKLTNSITNIEDRVSVDRMGSTPLDLVEAYVATMQKFKCNPRFLRYIKHFKDSLENAIQMQPAQYFFERFIIRGRYMYGFSSQLKKLLLKILGGLQVLYEQKMSYGDMCTKSLVFKEGDSEYKEPLITDVFDLQGGEPKHNQLWAKLSDIITHIIGHYGLLNQVTPEVNHFVSVLKSHQWARVSADRLRQHPSLFEKGQKLDQIVSLREKFYNTPQLWNKVENHFDATVCNSYDWKIVVHQAYVSDLTSYVNLMHVFNDNYHSDGLGLLDMSRNMREHLSENVRKYNRDNPTQAPMRWLSNVQIEALLEESFPTLLCYLFENMAEVDWVNNPS